jgi:hypothetical protein
MATRKPPPGTDGLVPAGKLSEDSPNGIPASADLTTDERYALIYSVKCPKPDRGGCDARPGKPCRGGFPCLARRYRAVERGLYRP